MNARKVAVVSANAFDKGLDNDVGMRAEDFILKPVRHTELLDWLERAARAALERCAAAPVAAAGAGGADVVVARRARAAARCRTSCSWATTAAS